MRKRIRLSFLALMILMHPSAVQSGTMDTNTKTILKMGQQMSNVRLMLETYSMIGIGIPYSDPSALLSGSMQSYEDALNTLEKDFSDETIQQGVKRSRTAWKPVKEALLTASNNADKAVMKKHAQFVHDHIRSVIKELAAAKKYLLKKANMKNSEALNASIEIGASARRLSAHYMMRLWQLKDPTIEEHWNNGLKIYGDSVAVLGKSDFAKNPAFKKLLDKSSKALRYFTMLSSLRTGHVPTLVHKKAERVYLDANEMSRIILSNVTQ